MISMLTLRGLVLAALAAVQGLSVVSEGDRTHVLIEVDGAVSYDHEMLTSPPRIVVDVSGTEFGLTQRRFMDIDRGGVLALRSSQFQPGVVRVVVDLAEAVDYQISETAEGLRISFRNPSGPFAAWTTGSVAGSVAASAADRQPLGSEMDGAPQPADRSAVPVPVSRPQVVQAPPQEQPPISVEFRNLPIQDVLATFAEFSGRSIVPGQGVGNQTITATILEQPWDEAMRAILSGQGLAAQELPSGIIMVTSLEQQRQRETQEQIVTEAFQLEYVAADSVAPQVEQLLQQGEGSAGTVAINRATNAVIVSARASVVDRLRMLIPSLDQRTPQVTVQVRILSVRRSDFSGLGIHYEIRDRGGTMLNRLTPGWVDADGDGVIDDGEEVPAPSQQVNLTGATIAAVGNAAERIPNATFEIISTLLLGSDHSLVAWLEAVERLELAELQADPVVTVLDNRTTRVHVGERTPIRVVDQGAASAQGPQAQVRTEETGVILEVTPHVVGDQVLLQLHAERSIIESFSTDAGYVFGTSETDTEILLNDAETAVISGLTTTDITRTQQGIPILMNLPLIGALFRNTFTEETKEDLLIMVTPYIHGTGGV